MLKTDFKDDIFAGARKYKMIENGDGTVSFLDVTEYTQEGDYLGANELNAITKAVNEKQDAEKGKGLSTEDFTSEDKKKLSGINPATAISATLSASAWTDGAQTVDAKGITAESIYTYDVDNSGATNDIIKAFCKANLTAAASENTITFTANGTTPSIDIPVTVVIL